MAFYKDMEKSLLQAIEMKKGEILLTEKRYMPAPTYVISDGENELIDKLVLIRKSQKMSQERLAKILGCRQQAISRIEKKAHSPSLKLFYSMVHALGYEIKLVKAKEQI